jgi:hypothetical protein
MTQVGQSAALAAIEAHNRNVAGIAGTAPAKPNKSLRIASSLLVEIFELSSGGHRRRVQVLC